MNRDDRNQPVNEQSPAGLHVQDIDVLHVGLGRAGENTSDTEALITSSHSQDQTQLPSSDLVAKMEKTEDWKARAHTNEESVRILQDHIRLLKLDFEEKLRAKDIAHEKSHAEWLLEKEKFVESAKQAAQRLQGERKEKRKFREAHKEVSKELQGSVSEIAELRKAVNDNKSKPQRMDKQIREVVKQLHEQEVNVAQLSKAKEALEIGLAEEMSTKARLREVPGSPWGHFVMTMGFRIQRKHFYLVESQGKWRQVRKRAEGILKNWYASEYEVFVKEAIEGDDEFFAFDEDDVVLQTKRSKF